MTQHDFTLIRDLHKEARGRRPSCDWDEWFAALPLAEKQVVWDDLVAESNERDAEEARAEQHSCREFLRAVRAGMRAGAPSGILFTPLGKAVIQRLDAMTDYKEI